MVTDLFDNNLKSNGGAEKERTAGQFFRIGEQGEQGDASAKVGAELHPLDYWVLDTGAAWTMTPRKELLDDVRAAPINEVCSASGHALKVAGAGRAAFKGADGKPVVLHDVLLVPDLKANLISLRAAGKSGALGSAREQGCVQIHVAAAGVGVAEDVASVVLDAVQRRTTTPTTNKEVPVGVTVQNLDVGANRNRHQNGGARRNQKNGANMVTDLFDNNLKSNGDAEKERTAGQFFRIGEQGEQGDASAKVGAELHPLDYWVLDTGAAWTMTPRKELLDDVRAAPINEVCSASGHALKVAGAGRAAFKGADGKPVVLHDVLLVPDLKANLISLRKLAKAGVSTSTDGARTYNGQLGNRVLWDLHESKDVYRSMWQLPALAWYGGGQAGEGCASQGECNAVGGDGVKVSARSGETDWATAHRRLGHVAMPLLKQLEKDGGVKGLKLNGQPPDDNCEICLLSKFTRFPFHSVTGRSKKPSELVHMDLVGPLPVQGHKGEPNFLTIVDDWSRLIWAYPLKQKDHAASTIQEDWLPFVEKQAECVVKRIRTDRGGEFLGAEMTAWLKKQGIQRELTMAYTLQSNGVAERANRTILETARALLIESGVDNSMCHHAVQHATVARNRVLTKVGNESWVPLERWLGRKPPVDMLRVDVKFVEGMMYGGWKKKPETKVSLQKEKITMQLNLNPGVWEEGEEAVAEGGDGEKVQEEPAGGRGRVEASGSTSGAANPEGELQQGKAKAPTLPKRWKAKGVVIKELM
ncbi:unnamed protein product [Closterium sp. NIES-53]